MPYRRLTFTKDVYYHICNRSVGSEKIFSSEAELNRAIDLINFYRFHSNISYSHLSQLTPEVREIRQSQIFSSLPIAEILSFSLMPTHFHFVLRQLVNHGIITFLKNIQNGFAKYYNIKYKRHGSVFTNRFKAIYITSEEQLFHVIRYVELNPVSGRLIEIDELEDYPYASFTTYMGTEIHPFINTELVLNHFKTPEKYKEFVFNQADYQRRLQEIKILMLE